jgi:hypothetical protein
MVESSAKVKPWREAVKSATRDLHYDGPLRLQWHNCGMAHTIVERCLLPGGHVFNTRWQDAFTGPVSIEVTFTLRKPASAPKRRTTWPQRKPDLDKLLRSTFDALGDAGVWVDDSQVVEVVARKVFPDEGVDALSHPGAVIRIWPVTP